MFISLITFLFFLPESWNLNKSRESYSFIDFKSMKPLELAWAWSHGREWERKLAFVEENGYCLVRLRLYNKTPRTGWLKHKFSEFWEFAITLLADLESVRAGFLVLRRPSRRVLAWWGAESGSKYSCVSPYKGTDPTTGPHPQE